MSAEPAGMKIWSALATLLLSTTALAACVTDAADDVNVAQTAQQVTSNNGISMNGISMNGISMNGISMNGISMNGISMNGISMNGISMNGSSMNGSTWSGSLSNGDEIALRIDNATHGTGADEDVGFYAVSYQTADGWQPMCGNDTNGQPILALSVAGTWNLQSGVAGGGAYTPSSSEFTFACRGKTIAKCVEMGYKTWNGYTDQLTSCVRLLRADYCGDGSPHTVNGTTLNLFDNVGVQADTEAWTPEAEWTPNGARCISAHENTRAFRVAHEAQQTCLNGHVIPTCGTSFANGAVLIDELPSN